MGLFAIAGLTDWVDGFIARRWNLQTVVGSVIDPMADKTLMTILTVTLAMQGLLPGLASFPMGLRDLENSPADDRETTMVGCVSSLVGGNYPRQRRRAGDIGHLLQVDIAAAAEDNDQILGFFTAERGGASNDY